MKIAVPSPLRSYTGEKAQVEARGKTLEELLQDMDRRYPGVRFRIINEQDQIREHIQVFVNGRQARDLSAPLKDADEIQIVCALSGG